MGKKALWIIIFSFVEIVLAKCSENTISNLNISFLELTSLVSYRFVPLSLLTIILTITNMSIPYLNLIGLVYLLLSDTYFCVQSFQLSVETWAEQLCEGHVQRRWWAGKQNSPSSSLRIHSIDFVDVRLDLNSSIRWYLMFISFIISFITFLFFSFFFFSNLLHLKKHRFRLLCSEIYKCTLSLFSSHNTLWILYDTSINGTN